MLSKLHGLERYAYCYAGRTDEYSVEKHRVNLVWSTVLITKTNKNQFSWSLTNEWRVFALKVYKRIFFADCRQRPYHVESTGSRPITEVKQRRARLVLGWVTAWEHRVLLATFFSFSFFFLFFFCGLFLFLSLSFYFLYLFILINIYFLVCVLFFSSPCSSIRLFSLL